MHNISNYVKNPGHPRYLYIYANAKTLFTTIIIKVHSQKETTSAEIQNLSFPFEIHVAESDIHRFCSS